MSRTVFWASAAVVTLSAQVAFAATLIASAPPAVTVPDVEGLSFSNARVELRELPIDLDVERVDGAATALDEVGNVIASDPPLGEPLRDGDTVELIVGIRSKPETVDGGRLPSGSHDFTNLQTVGGCANWESGGDESVVLVRVSCREPHTYQFYARFDLPIDDKTGLDLEAEAESRCSDHFAEFVGVELIDSLLDMITVPDMHSWTETSVVGTCLLFHPDGDLVGSAEDSLW